MKLSTASYVSLFTLSLMIPTYGMNDESNKEIIPLSAKIQAGVAAAAPLLVYPPLMAPVAAVIAATLADAPTLTIRAATTTALTMPMNGIAAAIADKYITPPSSELNKISKVMASFYLSNQTSHYLTQHQIIPPAPTHSTLSEFAGHTAVSYAVGSVTQRMIYSPYDRCMRNLDADYKKKDEAIAAILKEHDLSNAPTAQPLTQWNPSTNPATKHIKQKMIKKETLLWVVPEKASITCKLSLVNGEIFVSEGVWKKDSNSMQSLITKYTTDAAEWYYLQPLASSAFSKEIKQLHKTVLENHITAAGIPLKNIIPAAEEATDF